MNDTSKSKERLMKECFNGPLTAHVLDPNDPKIIEAIKRTQEAQERILKQRVITQESLDLRITI